jgi:predicted nucleotidyltransferase
MDLTFPAHAVVSTLDAEVLLTLAGTTLPMTGNQVRRVAGKGSLRGVQLVLQRLERHGLIDVLEAGSSNLYSLNRDHVATPAVLALVDLRGQLFKRISDEMNTWSIQPIAAAVFGSAARGDGGLESDIDLFIIRPPEVLDDNPQWGDQIAALSTLVRRWSGNAASAIQATPAQVSEMLSRNEPIVESLRRDAISLLGPNILVAVERAK